MKTIVYTAIIGDCDSLKPAPTGADEAWCLIDKHDIAAFDADPKGWTIAPMTVDGDPRRFAWKMRCIPHVVFGGGYDRVVWIDASFTLTDLPRLLKDAGSAPIAALRHHARSSCYEEGRELVKVGQARPQDIRRQLADYQRAGFEPKHLSISCIVVRDHSAAVQRFNEAWATDIDVYPGDNTQVSLDFCAWKHGIEIKALTGTRHKNPYSTHDHADHKTRRKPYRVPE
jgi:hypothetical protein